MTKLSTALVLIVLAAGTARAQQADAKAIEAALVAVDKAWCQAVIDRDNAKFLSMVAEDATFRGAVGAPLQGRDAVAKGWAQYFTAGGPTITWAPVRAQSLGSGDVGYTSGRAERHMKNAAGQDVTVHSEYVTVWKKQADGSWQVIFDGGAVLK